jgi:hypothetical protein
LVRKASAPASRNASAELSSATAKILALTLIALIILVAY